jgi:hypothetical protein
MLLDFLQTTYEAAANAAGWVTVAGRPEDKTPRR